MGSIILHISDLHVSLDKKIGGESNPHDSYLSTSLDKEPSFQFIDRFIDTIKKDFPASRIYLLVTGDITNAGEKKEFEFALEFLNRMILGLSINTEDILLLPGDHDLNRRSMEILLVNKEDSTEAEINICKYKNFSEFYYGLLHKEFDPNAVICSTLIVNDSILLLGLNSSIQINLAQRLGIIPLQMFEEELAKVPSLKDFKVIACTHHNLTSSYEDKNNGQWEPSNRDVFISKLISSGIEFLFTGNEHSNSAKSIKNGHLTASDAGTISSKQYESTFKVYEVTINDDIILSNKIYVLQKINNNDLPYQWDIRTNDRFDQPDSFTVSQKKPPEIDEHITEMVVDLDDRITLDSEVVENDGNKNEVADYYYDPEFSDVLYDQMRKINVFHSGHFHWSETSRAHNWIDVSKLIEDKETLDILMNAIADVINVKEIYKDLDLIIGLGYEGNIIASKSVLKYGMPYSFLPYSYRYEEHHKFEKELNFGNDDGKFQNVLIITDVVNDGRTIRKLIKKRHGDFFSNVKNVFVVSLFYTGQESINKNILNFNYLSNQPWFDKENDEEVNNITFYTIKTLKVEKCPYGKDFRQQCFIYKDSLSCVNLFYDESKYLKK
ncbi:metallophosphoesterase [Niabella aquatica]